MAIGGCFGGGIKPDSKKPSGMNKVSVNTPPDRKLSVTPKTEHLTKATAKYVKQVSTELDKSSDRPEGYSRLSRSLSQMHIKGKAKGSTEATDTVARRHASRVFVNSPETHKYNGGRVLLNIGKNESFGRVSVPETKKLEEAVGYLSYSNYHNNIDFSLELAVAKIIRSQVSTDNMLYRVCTVLERLCLGSANKETSSEMLSTAKEDLTMLLEHCKAINDPLAPHVLAMLNTLVSACDNSGQSHGSHHLGRFSSLTPKSLFSEIMTGNIALLRTSVLQLTHQSRALMEADKTKVSKILEGAYDAMGIVAECLEKAGLPTVYQFTDETLGK